MRGRGMLAAVPTPDLLRVIDATIADFSSMPFFVRPMVKAGMRKRTGRSVDEWRVLAQRIATTSASALLAAHPDLVASLDRLADHYRTAPERAARAMKGAALERITETSRERERVVRELIAELRSGS